MKKSSSLYVAALNITFKKKPLPARKYALKKSCLNFQEGKIAEIQKFADQLVQNRHYAAVQIAERRASVLTSWAKLKESLADWRSKLGQLQNLQTFTREVDEADGWIADKLQIAADESYRDPTNLQGKLQKHEAFEAEVAANKERIYGLMQAGKGRAA